MARGEEILQELLYLLDNEDDRLVYRLLCSLPNLRKEMISEGIPVECILKPIH